MCVSESAIAPWNRRSGVESTGASDARYSSSRFTVLKNRDTSSSHAKGVELFHFCAPCAIDRAQSYRSPMCARICAGVFGGSPDANVAKLAGAPRTALPPRYATVASVCRSNARLSSITSPNASAAKLPKVMIHVPVQEHDPRPRRQPAKCRVIDPWSVRAACRESIHQCRQRPDVAGPFIRRRRDHELRLGGRVLRERREVDDQLFEGRIPQRQVLRRDRQLTKRHPQALREVTHHLLRRHLSPPRSTIRGQRRKAIGQFALRGGFPDGFHRLLRIRLQQVTAPSALATSLAGTHSTRRPRRSRRAAVRGNDAEYRTRSSRRRAFAAIGSSVSTSTSANPSNIPLSIHAGLTSSMWSDSVVTADFRCRQSCTTTPRTL